MENEFEYKQDILNTRVGCLGSSDAKLLAQVSNSGAIPQGAKKRLAIVKGLVEPQDGFKTRAMRCGDIIENLIYQNLSYGAEEKYQSNPLWVSKKYSRKNVKLISHPDIVYVDDYNNTVNVYEVKTTQETFEATRAEYYAQLFVHNLIAIELYPTYKISVSLVHYSTKGMDLQNMTDEDIVDSFDPTRITTRKCKFSGLNFDVHFAMDRIDQYLEKLDCYFEGDEVDADLLPANVKEQFDKVAMILTEIKERETKVDEFKTKLYDFLVDKGIKSIRNDEFTITRVDPSESHTFDSKKFLDDYAVKYPRKVKKLIKEFDKCTKRKGYAKITVKKED